MQALPYEQIIIAGGDEDVTSGELFEWVAPLLAGIPGGRWMSCQLEPGPGEELIAHLREGASGAVLSLPLGNHTAEAREILGQLPDAQSLTMIMLTDFASQAVTLLDGMAMWLNVFEADDPSIIPILDMLALWRRPEKIAAAS